MTVPRTRTFFIVAGFLTVISRASVGIGETPPDGQPELDLAACPEVDRSELMRVYTVEAKKIPDTDYQLHLTCLSGGKARLAKKTPAWNREKLIDLTRFPADARARILGTSLSELAIADTPVQPPALPNPVAPAAQVIQSLPTERSKSSTYILEGEVGMEFLTGPSLPLYGGGIRATGEHGAHLGWSADILYLHGSQSTPAGTTMIDALSIGGIVSGRYRISVVDLRAGAGFRGGVAWLTSSPSEPASTDPAGYLKWTRTTGFFLGPMAQIGVSFKLPRKAVLGVSFEGGYNVVTATGTDPFGFNAGIEGGWIGLQLSAGGEL